MDIPLARGDYQRTIAKEARIRLRNRYFEQNPVLNDEPTALLARPGLRRWMPVGDGPIRSVYSEPGAFGDDLFVASGDKLYRVSVSGVVTLIGDIPSLNPKSSVSMAATSNIGTTPAYLFVASGSSLMCYMEDGYAHADVSGSPADADTIRVGDTYYRFVSGSVDTGTPAGTLANPWLVKQGPAVLDSWRNFANALAATGVSGTDYSSALTANPSATITFYTGSTVRVRALAAGVIGDLIPVTTTGNAIVWSSATLMGGGEPFWFQVKVPEDYGIISLAYIASHIVAVPTQGQDINGRFYWIKPGETIIDALDFATAERAPDPIHSVVVMGDQFWLMGTSTTEVWYFTGNIQSPVARMQGVVYDRGTWEGTTIRVGDSLILVDPEGAVFKLDGGISRISRPDVEQRIRQAIQRQAGNS